MRHCSWHSSLRHLFVSLFSFSDLLLSFSLPFARSPAGLLAERSPRAQLLSTPILRRPQLRARRLESLQPARHVVVRRKAPTLGLDRAHSPLRRPLLHHLRHLLRLLPRRLLSVLLPPALQPYPFSRLARLLQCCPVHHQPHSRPSWRMGGRQQSLRRHLRILLCQMEQLTCRTPQVDSVLPSSLLIVIQTAV